MSALTLTLGIVIGALIGLAGAFYYLKWQAKKVQKAFAENLANLMDPEKSFQKDGDTSETTPAA